MTVLDTGLSGLAPDDLKALYREARAREEEA
jgi:hypothetical protein